MREEDFRALIAICAVIYVVGKIVKTVINWQNIEP